MRRVAGRLPLLLALLQVTAASAAGDHLVTRLDVDHVEVTTRFQGQSILVFGAVSPGTDVIIEMRSPDQDVELAHKARVGPLWVEAGHLVVSGVPGLVYLLSSSPLDRLLRTAVRQRLGLTLESPLAAARTRSDAALRADWQAALLRLKDRRGYYLVNGRGVSLEMGRLFYSRVDLPAEAPLGRYRLFIYLVRGGQVVRRQQQTLVVQEAHLTEWISRVAHVYPWAFGVLLTLGMMLLGLVLGMVLRAPRDA
jgi:uncharacterized protein (TIGR02186 family)